MQGQQTRDQIQPFKVVLIGNSGVGKSSICSRFTQNVFDPKQNSTVAAAFKSKSVEIQGINICFNIWDTAGQERYKSIARMYYRDASAIILVYDITEKISFESLQEWHQDIINNCSFTPILAVVGNKEDLCIHEEVNVGLASQFSLTINAHYTKTSAKSSYGVNQLFEYIGERCLEKFGNVTIQKNSRLKDKVEEKKKKCC